MSYLLNLSKAEQFYKEVSIKKVHGSVAQHGQSACLLTLFQEDSRKSRDRSPPGPLFTWVQINHFHIQQQKKGDTSLPAKLSTTVANIKKKLHNQVNQDLISGFYYYLKTIDTSENYQNGLLKVLLGMQNILDHQLHSIRFKIKNR